LRGSEYNLRATDRARSASIGDVVREVPMATAKQKAAARKNIKKAAATARRKKTISRLPKAIRTALGKEGAKAAQRKRRSAKGS
jgi:hypothetical protein